MRDLCCKAHNEQETEEIVLRTHEVDGKLAPIVKWLNSYQGVYVSYAGPAKINPESSKECFVRFSCHYDVGSMRNIISIIGAFLSNYNSTSVFFEEKSYQDSHNSFPTVNTFYILRFKCDYNDDIISFIRFLKKHNHIGIDNGMEEMEIKKVTVEDTAIVPKKMVPIIKWLNKTYSVNIFTCCSEGQKDSRGCYIVFSTDYNFDYDFGIKSHINGFLMSQSCMPGIKTQRIVSNDGFGNITNYYRLSFGDPEYDLPKFIKYLEDTGQIGESK